MLKLALSMTRRNCLLNTLSVLSFFSNDTPYFNIPWYQLSKWYQRRHSFVNWSSVLMICVRMSFLRIILENIQFICASNNNCNVISLIRRCFWMQLLSVHAVSLMGFGQSTKLCRGHVASLVCLKIIGDNYWGKMASHNV